MNQLLRRRAKAIFQEALEKPPRERRAFVTETTSFEPELRTAVLELIAAHDSAGEFLGAPTLGHERARTNVAEQQVGDVIGHYELREKLGEGGFGVVWRAEQLEPVRREVALKVIKLGMDTKAVVARFEAERQALALMDHPGIARVFDGGATEKGRPYFVMELVRGVPITRYCAEHELDVEARLAIFTTVCRAVQHAHQKGVIHRDIKPGNVLVTLQDGAPVPKVIDFGIAKATSANLADGTLVTELRQVIGTLEYMAPEQSGLSGIDVDTRADVYSLGVLLYELLTGAKPFDFSDSRERGLDEIVRVIREVEPKRPSTRVSTLANTASVAHTGATGGELRRRLTGDLDWIVMKALEKDRERRYETALALAEDVERHVAHLPVLARPPSRLYSFAKLVRRNRLAFGAAAVVFVALLAGMLVATWGLVEAKAQRAAAESQTRIAKSELETRKRVAHFLSEMLRGAGPSVAMGRDATILREILDRTRHQLDTQLAGEDDVRARLLDVLGVVLAEIGDLDEAVRMLEESVSLWRRVHPEVHIDVALGENNLAHALIRMGRYGEAEIHLRESLRLFELLGNEPAHELARVHDNLGQALLRQHRLDEAESHFGISLDLERSAAVAYGPDTGLAEESLAELHRVRGDFPEAERMYAAGLERARQELGLDHPRTLTLNNNLAATWNDMGREADAKCELENVLERMSKVYGPDSELSGMTLENLAQAKKQLGDETGALVDLEAALAIFRSRARGGDATPLARTLCRKARLLIQLKRAQEAGPALEEGIAMYERLNRAPEFDWAEGLADRANLREESEDFAGSELDSRRALVIAEQIDPQSRHVARLYNDLGGLFVTTKRYADAALEMDRAVAIQRALPAQDSADLATMLGNLAVTRLRAKDFERAEPAAREAYALRREAGGPAESLVDTAFWLSRILAELGRFDESAQYLAESHALDLELAGKNRKKRSERMRLIALRSFHARAAEWGRERLLEALALESNAGQRDLAGYGQTCAILAAFDSQRGTPGLTIDHLRECVVIADRDSKDELTSSSQRILLAAQLVDVAAVKRDAAPAREAVGLLEVARVTREKLLDARDWRLRYLNCLIAAAAGQSALHDASLAASELKAALESAVVILERELPSLLAGDMPQPGLSLRSPTATSACARFHDALTTLDPSGRHSSSSRTWYATTEEVRVRSVD